jgi:hypothetical protein
MNSVATGSGVQGPVGQLEKWSASSRRVEAEILRHLGEVDAQGLWADAAYSSLAAYCMGHLGYSEQMAYKRIRVVRLSREIPGILRAIAEGRATVCGLCTVASLVTADNAGDWMAKIAGKTKREIEALAALARVEAGRPAPAPRNTLRALPTLPASAGASAPPAPTLLLPPNSPRGGDSPRLDDSPRPTPVVPNEVLHRLSVTLSAATRAKLERAQALLRHAVPNGDPATILDRALDALIAATEQRRFGAGARRKAASTLTLPATLPTGTKERRRRRAIPAAVRRAVFERDGGACAFVDAAGKRCGCTSAVELHHVVPFAMGGAHSAENLRVYCRAHNQRQGERDFGPRG